MTERDDRLDELDDDIERTKDEARKADILDDPDEPKFRDTGELSDVEDRNIAPG
jgi:hypothetical protein